jgi:predicted nucleic acid-binding protein
MKAAIWLKTYDRSIPLTCFHELELINALQLKKFRQEISENDNEQVISRFYKHEKKGVYFRPILEWSDVFNRAMDLSQKFSKAIGSRSLDILHVASALSIKAQKFLTLDGRQTELARLAKLEIVTL